MIIDDTICLLCDPECITVRLQHKMECYVEHFYYLICMYRRVCMYTCMFVLGSRPLLYVCIYVVVLYHNQLVDLAGSGDHPGFEAAVDDFPVDLTSSVHPQSVRLPCMYVCMYVCMN